MVQYQFQIIDHDCVQTHVGSRIIHKNIKRKNVIYATIHLCTVYIHESILCMIMCEDIFI